MSVPVASSEPLPSAVPSASSTLGAVDPTPRRLLLVAPRAFWAPVREAYAATGVDVTVRERPAAGTDRRDPYGVTRLSARDGARPARSSPDGLLLVAPTRRGPRRLLPGPLVGDVPVGVVQADAPAALAPWLAAVGDATPAVDESPRRAVLAMGTNRCLDLGRAVLERLADADDADVLDWRADRLSATALAARLASGPTLAAYVGHGRARGWSGYQAFRWHHVAAEPQRRPTGTVVALACDTLTRHRMVVPFGVRLVADGRACAYLGVAGSLRTTTAERLAAALADCLVDDCPPTVGDLLRGVDASLARADDTDARRALAGFRLVGSPFAPV